MSDRIKGYVVTLSCDIKDEDADAIENALSMVKGVASVTPSVVDFNDRMNRERIRIELSAQLLQILHKERP